MKFAFSSSCCPQWDEPATITRAKELGFDGIELRMNATRDLPALRAKLDDAKLPLVCLGTNIAHSANRDKDASAQRDARAAIDAAAALGCGLVSVQDTLVSKGQPRMAAVIALGDFLSPLADYAGEKGVTLALENALSFRAAGDIWLVLDRLMHPNLAVCWNALAAARAGETPGVSVPTLNSRIAHVRLSDAKLSPLAFAKLGEGQVGGERLITRLRGVGFRGFVSVDYDRSLLPDTPAAEELLPAAIETLKKWDKLGTASPAAPKAKAAKAAAAKAKAPAPKAAATAE